MLQMNTSPLGVVYHTRSSTYTVSLKKRHCFGLLQLPCTSTNFDNFGRTVTKEASSQMVLYFPTSPN